jgi:predicted Zn-dependent protease
MNTKEIKQRWEKIFNEASELLYNNLKEGESLNINLSAEETDFIRLNNAKVRQASTVEQGDLALEIHHGHKKSELGVPLTLSSELNKEALASSLKSLQEEVRSLPDDPFLIPMTNEGESHTQMDGSLPATDNFVKATVEACHGSDLAGYLTSGTSIRANSNSLGQKHWFASDSFFFDYSLYSAKERAVKGSYAGSKFDIAELNTLIKDSKQALEVMDRDKVELKPGKYKAYLAPAALHEVTGMMGWHALSGGAYKRGECPLGELYEGKKSFHKSVFMKENFGLGLSPRFNEYGEVAKNEIPLVSGGKMDNLLVSRETAKEYGMTSNQSSGSEGPRALEVGTGSLKREDILKELGTGLFLSNLHYLNWSDKTKGRLTGMTRFGCLWVENGEIVGPIKDLRFDETLYHIFGQGLESITDFSEVMMETSTYGNRSLGGSRVPGLLVNDFSFTL